MCRWENHEFLQASVSSLLSAQDHTGFLWGSNIITQSFLKFGPHTSSVSNLGTWKWKVSSSTPGPTKSKTPTIHNSDAPQSLRTTAKTYIIFFKSQNVKYKIVIVIMKKLRTLQFLKILRIFIYTQLNISKSVRVFND